MGTLSKVAKESTPSQWGYNPIVNRVAKHSFSCVAKLAIAEKENILYKVAKVIVALVSSIILVPLASVRALTSYTWNRIRGEKPDAPPPAKTTTTSAPQTASKPTPPAKTPAAPAPAETAPEPVPDLGNLHEAMRMPEVVTVPAPAPKTSESASGAILDAAPEEMASLITPPTQPPKPTQETLVNVRVAAAFFGSKAGPAPVPGSVASLFPVVRNDAGAGSVTVTSASEETGSTDHSSIRSGKSTEDQRDMPPKESRRGTKNRSICRDENQTLRELEEIFGANDPYVKNYRDKQLAGPTVPLVLVPVDGNSAGGAASPEAEPAARTVASDDDDSPRERTERKERDPSWNGTANEADFMMHKAPPPEAAVSAVITKARGMAKLPPKVKQPNGPEVEQDPAKGGYRARRPKSRDGSGDKLGTAKFNRVLKRYFVPGSPAESAALEAHRKQQEAAANA